MKAFRNALVFVEGQGLVKTSLSFDKTIKNIGEDLGGDVIELPEDAMVLPGFIDIHTHGAGGSDAMDATLSDLQNIANTVAMEGTTTLLATTMTQSPENILSGLRAVKEYMSEPKKEGAEIIGVHLEGPFICRRFCGAQPLEYIATPDKKVFDEYMEASGNSIRVLTVAPETEGALDFIKSILFLRKR